MARSETQERLVSQAARWCPRCGQSLAAAEQARRLPQKMFGELAAADVFRMTAPRRFGGFEADSLPSARYSQRSLVAARPRRGWRPS